MSALDKIVAIAGVVAAFAALVLWTRASLNTWAALASFITMLCGAYLFWRQLHG